MMSISKEESNIISWIRVLSMAGIVICHICETYCNKWAYVFNIGVQTFFVLSGFLYGHKNITNFSKWLLGRVSRVYIPMIILLLLMLPIYLIFKPDFFSWKVFLTNVLNLQGFFFAWGGVMLLGVRHLWFVTAIFSDYLLTPFLQKLRDYADFLIICSIILLFFSYCCLPGPLTFIISWFILYSIGYLYVSSKHQTKWLIIISSIGLISFLICLLSGWTSITQYFNPIGRCLHDFGGTGLVLLPLYLLRKRKIVLPYIIKVLDNYSFQIYLIHYILIIGPFSIAHYFENIYINIIVVLLSTVLFTFVFCKINNKILNIQTKSPR